MGNDLKNLEFINKLYVPDDKKKKGYMKKHKKDPKYGLMSANGGQKESVMEYPKPSMPLMGIDLQGSWISWFKENLKESYAGSQYKDAKGHIYHRYQYYIINRIHGAPLLGKCAGMPSPADGDKWLSC